MKNLLMRLVALMLLCALAVPLLGSCTIPGAPGEKGEKGDKGDSVTVVSCTLTSTEGLVDTYTLTFSDGTATSFNVTNGRDGETGSAGTAVTMVSLNKTASYGNTDTYTMRMSDGSSFSFDVKNGKDGENGEDGAKGDDGAPGENGTDGVSITSIAKTKTEGNVDTYTIFYSNGESFDFTVTNAESTAPVEIDEVLYVGTADSVQTYKIIYTDGAENEFSLCTKDDADTADTNERSEVLLAYDSAVALGYSGSENEWVISVINMLKDKYLTERSTLEAVDFGRAIKKILDSSNTYLSVNATPTGEIETRIYETAGISGYYFSNKSYENATVTYYGEKIDISIGDTVSVTDSSGAKMKLKFVDAYGADGTCFKKLNNNGKSTTYFSADGSYAFTIPEGPDGAVPTQIALTWYYTMPETPTETFTIKIEHAKTELTVGTTAALSADTIYAIANGVGGGDVTVGGGYITEGDSNIIVSKIIGTPTILVSAKTLAAGTTLRAAENVLINGQSITLSADLTAALADGQSIIIGHGDAVKSSSYVTLTKEKLILTNQSSVDDAKVEVLEFNHGLTVEGYVRITVDVTEGKASIRLMTPGGYFEKTELNWLGRNGAIFARGAEVDLENVALRYHAAALSEKIWIFGDSLINYNTDARWTYYLKEAGYINNAIFGFPGMGVADALKSFKWAVDDMGATPKFALWFIGCNNGDTLGTTNINAAWLTATEEFLEICEKKGITPILMTYLTGPCKTNSDVPFFNANKSEWVRNSGYRYVDIAHAVGCDVYDESLIGTSVTVGSITKENITGYDWYDGMISTDFVHPYALGAKAMFMQIITDFPEITEKD